MIQSQHQAANVYTDIHALQGIRQLGKEDKNAALMEVAKQFESMFLNMMLSSMRQANQVFKEDSLFSSSESDFYQKMYDDQMALSLSGSQGTGLAKMIHRQMLSNYGLTQEQPELDHSKLRRHDSSLKQAIARVDALLAQPEPQPFSPVESPASTATTADTTAASGGGKRQQFASAEAFVAAVYPQAQVVAEQLQVDAKAIVAQAALETGWGKYMISDSQGNNSFNFFGIKADARWSGERVNVLTHEYRDGVRVNETASFRAYASLEDGLADYANFLSQHQRYSQAVGQGLTGNDYGHALQQAGYATDPAYGAKIQRISGSDRLNQAVQQLDAGVGRAAQQP